MMRRHESWDAEAARSGYASSDVMDSLRAHSWPIFLGKDYRFAKGDAVPTELVGASEKEDRVSYEFLEGEGDVYLKGRSGRDPLSHIAGEFWVIPRFVEPRRTSVFALTVAHAVWLATQVKHLSHDASFPWSRRARKLPGEPTMPAHLCTQLWYRCVPKPQVPAH